MLKITRETALRGGVLATAVAALACGLVACGGDDSQGSGAQSGASSGAAAKPPAVVKIGRPVTLTTLVIDLANDLGYYGDAAKALGTKIEVVPFGGEGAGVSALVSGDVQMSIQQATSGISANLQGQNLEIVQELADGGAGCVVGNTSIKSPADFKGKTIAFTSLASVAYAELLAAFKQEGVDSSGVKFVSVGSQAPMVAALKSGRVDAIGAGEPLCSQLKSEGKAGYVYNFYDKQFMNTVLDGPIISLTFMTSRDFMQKQPAVVQAVVNANLKALRYMHAHASDPETVLNVLGKDYAQYRALWPQIYPNVLAAMSTDGQINPEAFNQAVALSTTVGAVKKGQTVNTSDLFTTKFAENSLTQVK